MSDNDDRPKKKKRGPTTCKKFKKKASNTNSIEFDELSRPIGKYSDVFVNYIGVLARAHVDINIVNWKRVGEDLKNTIWEDVKKEFNLDDKKKKLVLQIAGMRWKDFKTRLANRFIKNTHPNYESPVQLYDFLTKEQWEKFKKNREIQDFKKISEKARASSSYNEHPHYLGRRGYAGKRDEWIVSDPLQISTSFAQLDSSSIISFDDRSLNWVRARSKKQTDGTYYIPNEKTREVYDKVIKVREEMSPTTFLPMRHHDALSHAIGKGEHSGHVRGCVHVTIRDVYGNSNKTKKAPCGVISVNDLKQLVTKEVIEETRVEMQNQIEAMRERYDSILKSMGVQLPNDMEVDMNPSHHTSTCNSCHSIDPDPFANLENPTPCRLAISHDPTMIVAMGMVYPTNSESVMHHQQIMINFVKVSIDNILPGAEKTLLPTPSQHLTMVGEVIGSFVQWPKHLVILEKETISKVRQEDKGKKVQSGDLSFTKPHPLIDDAIVIENLSEQCKILHSVASSMPKGLDLFHVPLKEVVFGYANEMVGISVNLSDILDLLTMDWLNVSILQIWETFLYDICDNSEVNSIGFMCPGLLAMAKKDLDATVNYIKESMRRLASKKYILAPYIQGQHWILLVIDCENNKVFMMDSSKSKRTLDIKPALSIAFRIFLVDGNQKKIGELKWIQVECPQQPGGTECGYYVMRFMYDIVILYNQIKDSLEKDFPKSYTLEDIEEVRNLWAEYFVYECI